MKDARIMIVDDEPAMAAMLHEYLTVMGAQVVSYNNPQLALQAFAAQPHNTDLVITDESMPHMSGRVLAQSLLQLKPALPVILCTGYSKHATAASVAEIGIAAFFNKPLNMAELLLKIDSLLHRVTGHS